MSLTRRRVLAGIAALAAVTGLGAGARAYAARYHDGPVSDHFDGVRFFDPHGAPPNSRLDFLRWQLGGTRAKWPDWVPGAEPDRPPRRVADARWRISFVGHVTLLIQTAGLNILVDPVWSERASPFTFVGPKRVNDPGIAFDALPPIDVVLVTHNHYDHLDVATLARLARTHRPRVITPFGNDAIMQAADPAIRAEAHDWGDRVDLGSGCAVHLVPARHWSARGLFDRNKALWCAFLIETPAGRIFYVGDSGYGDGRHFRDVRDTYGPIRLACLPIGAYEPRWFMREQHMNPEEAVRALLDCGAEQALAHHFGTFQLTDEPFDAPAQALETARQSAGVAPERFRALKPGQVWEL
ncbi:MAG: MBL fold metallo-hydrolase [Rhizobiales bacterium]|nr:MBL fold metallo-hydrolase [Hyphomicrobiales bacterium]